MEYYSYFSEFPGSRWSWKSFADECTTEGNCPNSYCYAYDESSGTALWTCASDLAADYTVTFCPDSSEDGPNGVAILGPPAKTNFTTFSL